MIKLKLDVIMKYPRIKNQESKYFRTIEDLRYFYGISRKTFYKYLKRYKNSKQLGIKHKRTKIRRPQTNGKDRED